jgi:hypothetical protein
MILSESELTRKLDKVLISHGVMVEALVAGRMNKIGRPDRWYCWLGEGGGVWVELKKGANLLTPQQKQWHVECRRRGGKALVARFCDWKLDRHGYLQVDYIRIADKAEEQLGWVGLNAIWDGDKDAVKDLLDLLAKS